jgi:hypothetical protein
MTIEELVQEATKTAKEHGFHDIGRTVGDSIALIHSELSEALEEYRTSGDTSKVWYLAGKPIGFLSEMADAMIRIAESCGYHGITPQALESAVKEKLKYNKTREYLHGGKKL